MLLCLCVCVSVLCLLLSAVPRLPLSSDHLLNTHTHTDIHTYIHTYIHTQDTVNFHFLLTMISQHLLEDCKA